MVEVCRWTKSKARLKQLCTNSEAAYNWLFLPGGPGLGSESLQELTDMLHLPGTMWCADFPDDGSNRSVNNDKDFANWQSALVEATSELDNVILVAHSSGGMFALATPALENIIKGLVLMDSAPDAGWQKCFIEYVTHHPIAEAERLQKEYNENPSDGILKQLTIACVPYFSTTKSIKQITIMLASLPFHYKSHLWAELNFDKEYKAKWIPQEIPTLIFAGDDDHLTPLKLFAELKEFQRNNIKIREIKAASHFPWIDNPEQVKDVFAEYCRWIGR